MDIVTAEGGRAQKLKILKIFDFEHTKKIKYIGLTIGTTSNIVTKLKM